MLGDAETARRYLDRDDVKADSRAAINRGVMLELIIEEETKEVRRGDMKEVKHGDMEGFKHGDAEAQSLIDLKSPCLSDSVFQLTGKEDAL